jgi:hypothetical protein
VTSQPTVQLLTFVPTGSVPADEQDPFALITSHRQQPLQHQDNLIGVGLTFIKIEVASPGVLAHGPITSQGFVRFIFGRQALDQTIWFSGCLPTGQGWLREATEPTFILIQD